MTAPVLTIKDIGLAAFVKANGAQLVSWRNGAWAFVSDKPLKEWRTEYSNSCCRRHDVELLELRRLSRQETL